MTVLFLSLAATVVTATNAELAHTRVDADGSANFLGQPPFPPYPVPPGDSLYDPLLGATVAGSVNDPLTKQRKQTCLDAMGVAAAWDKWRLKATRDVIVAVIDTGITSDHEDLRDALWKDQEGHIGYNFMDLSFDVTDTVGHGTMMAGVVAATLNNSVGMAGVSGFPTTKIMSLKIMGKKTESMVEHGVPLALLYAVDHGSRVILNAYGTADSQFLRDAIDLLSQQGVFIVSAAGNDGKKDGPSYPCWIQTRGTLCVGATTSTGKRLAKLSNYGRSVDVAAPGVDVLVTATKYPYDVMDGTSPAAALVAGAVAFMYSLGVDPQNVKEAIMGTAHPLQGSRTIATGLIDLPAAIAWAMDLQGL